MAIQSVNPATGESIRTYDETAPGDLATILDRVDEARRLWRGAGFAERSAPMRAAARILRARADSFARLMTEEMGKRVDEARAECEKCAWVCEHYAEHAERILGRETIETDARHSFVTFEPLGIVLAIMPWNFPFWQVFRFAAPAMMAGNAALLKHAPNVPGCALAIEEVFREAGFPTDLFRAVLIPNAGVDGLIDDPRIAAVTVTGSRSAGSAIAARAGAMLKKTVLELGGSDAYVVLEDAVLEPAIEACATGRLLNAGQSCIAAKRIVVPRALRDRFEKGFVERMRAVRMGDPSDPDVDLGPQARFDLRDDLHRQVRESVDRGARCLLGGEIPARPGAFYPATVLTDVAPDMPAYDEELFGPVAAIIPAADDDDAIRIANDSVFGLGAAVFTRDPARGERIAADRLEAGACFVNAFVKSDPRLPFGGVKQSGYGRELGEYGIKEFVNIKTVYVS